MGIGATRNQVCNRILDKARLLPPSQSPKPQALTPPPERSAKPKGGSQVIEESVGWRYALCPTSQLNAQPH